MSSILHQESDMCCTTSILFLSLSMQGSMGGVLRWGKIISVILISFWSNTGKEIQPLRRKTWRFYGWMVWRKTRSTYYAGDECNLLVTQRGMPPLSGPHHVETREVAGEDSMHSRTWKANCSFPPSIATSAVLAMILNVSNRISLEA